MIDTIGANTMAANRRKLGSNAGVVRVRRCVDGHDFETIEMRRNAYDALVAS